MYSFLTDTSQVLGLSSETQTKSVQQVTSLTKKIGHQGEGFYRKSALFFGNSSQVVGLLSVQQVTRLTKNDDTRRGKPMKKSNLFPYHPDTDQYLHDIVQNYRSTHPNLKVLTNANARHMVPTKTLTHRESHKRNKFLILMNNKYESTTKRGQTRQGQWEFKV